MAHYQMDSDFLDDPDQVSDISGWSLLSPTPKALPLPVHAQPFHAPRIRSPFQVTDLQQPPLQRDSTPLTDVGTSKHPIGLPRPALRESSIASLSFPNRPTHVGLVAPEFSQPYPRSFGTDPTDMSSAEVTSPDFGVVPAKLPQRSSRPQHFQGRAQTQQQVASNLTRVRIAAKSPVVWNLWLRLSSSLYAISQVIQQLQDSAFPVEHAERFLNQYAATTLVRYMSCILQFIDFCSTLHVDIATLTETQLADLLISGSLARRSDGSGPKFSVTIKALRWAHKQLGIPQLACVFGPLIASFDKQKLPSDRRESLPFPLFILMRWERRILQAMTSVQEIVILGGFLLLCWSGLRFSDIQRSHLATWQLDSQTLRGLTWRAKTCHAATPFGIVLSGLLSCGTKTWVHRYLQVLDDMYAAESPEVIDFAIPAFDKTGSPVIPFDAMTYAEALFYIRLYLTLPWSSQGSQLSIDASSYSVHGLKATVLSWAAQANLPEEDRRVHGKHKPSQMSVQLYSRDDILGSLRVQSALITQIAQGWRPVTPLSRGGQMPLVEPKFTMERFKKDGDPVEWKFFQFNKSSSLQTLANLPDVPEAISSGESSSEDSDSSSSSSSSDEQAGPKPAKAPRLRHADLKQYAEEAIVGLHRRTWHVMIASDSQQESIPSWQGQSLKTACGRFLTQMSITTGMEFGLSTGQSLCSHVGCRKGFQSVGMSD